MNATPDRPHSPLQRRLHRGFEALFAPFRRVDNGPAEALLTPAAFNLFRQMSSADRSHSLRAYRWLVEHGYEQYELLVAGLLHDCGKAATHLTVWQRTLKVLLKRLAPSYWRRLSALADADNWRYPFYILAEHARIGAEWAEEAGCSELTCWLIAHHETDIPREHPRYDLLRALQDADAAS
jgi:hypothetical protein